LSVLFSALHTELSGCSVAAAAQLDAFSGVRYQVAGDNKKESGNEETLLGFCGDGHRRPVGDIDAGAIKTTVRRGE
jgi:hypothetical protein